VTSADVKHKSPQEFSSLSMFLKVGEKLDQENRINVANELTYNWSDIGKEDTLRRRREKAGKRLASYSDEEETESFLHRHYDPYRRARS